MIITIDETASEPLYKQIHDQVIAGIATGQLEPGMPSCLLCARSPAAGPGINLHTVNKAYAILRDEGYVQMRGRAGAVISEPSDAGRAEKNRETLSAIEDDLFKLALTYRACGGARGEFVESAAAQAARAYATISDVPESASTKRSMKKHPARSSAKKGRGRRPFSTRRVNIMQAIDPIMLALLGFVLLFVPITGGLMAATPYLMPKRECFAVTIPDAASNDPEIKHLKRSYFTIVIVATLAFTALCIVCICLDPERAFLPALVVSVLIICLGSYALMLHFRQKTIALKRARGWEAQTAKRVGFVAEEPAPKPLSQKWDLFFLIPITITGLVCMVGYPLMPEHLATNIDLSGQVAHWMDKTPLTACRSVLDRCVPGWVLRLFALEHPAFEERHRCISPCRKCLGVWSICARAEHDARRLRDDALVPRSDHGAFVHGRYHHATSAPSHRDHDRDRAGGGSCDLDDLRAKWRASLAPHGGAHVDACGR